MTDYHQILSRAIASLEPNTAQARARLFDRARQMLLDRIRDESSRWTEAEAEAEVASFDAAIKRIEADAARRATSDARSPHHRPDAPTVARSVPSKRSTRIAIWGSAAVLCALLIAAVYAFRSGTVATTKSESGVAVKAVPETAKAKPSTTAALDTGELEPGVDGGSTDAALPYFLRRQMVYYRSVYTDGMVVVDRSQRFLYLLLPQSRALRYGIGIGGECPVSAGLYRIQNTLPWPEWSPSPALLKRRAYPPRLAGGPGNPLGAHAMYFEGNYPSIHGTNAPRTIGQAPSIGCFRLVNDDVVDLAKRVAVGTGVVVLN